MTTIDDSEITDALYARLESLSKSLESSDRIDGMENKYAYPTILAAMKFVQERSQPRKWERLTTTEKIDLARSIPGCPVDTLIIGAIESAVIKKNGGE